MMRGWIWSPTCRWQPSKSRATFNGVRSKNAAVRTLWPSDSLLLDKVMDDVLLRGHEPAKRRHAVEVAGFDWSINLRDTLRGRGIEPLSECSGLVIRF